MKQILGKVPRVFFEVHFKAREIRKDKTGQKEEKKGKITDLSSGLWEKNINVKSNALV